MADPMQAALRALKLAEHDQIDFVGVCRAYIDETDNPGRRNMRTMRANAVADRLRITRAAIKGLTEVADGVHPLHTENARLRRRIDALEAAGPVDIYGYPV